MPHTPGPWTIAKVDETFLEDYEGHAIDAPDAQRFVAYTTCTFLPNEPHPENFLTLIGAHVITEEEDHCNAMLITAAPDLLAACKLLTALEDNNVHDADTRWKTARNNMRNAIAKAEGVL